MPRRFGGFSMGKVGVVVGGAVLAVALIAVLNRTTFGKQILG